MRSPIAGTRSSGSSPRAAAAASGGTCASRATFVAAAKPDVVYAHFLVPTGLSAALFGRAPLVATAHGRDVRNIGAYPGIRAATRFVARRASSLIAVSDYLRRELEAKIPEARGKTEVVDCGVDLSLFGTRPVSDTGPVQNGPVFVCVGSLIERKNVVRLADAFATLDEGRLVFVGDGPLRSELEGRPNVEITGRVPHDEVPRYVAEATVLCQPSLIEPFGQALLEGMAAGKSVVATRVGGPPEFVPPEAGVLVDPLDTTALADGMRQGRRAPAAESGRPRPRPPSTTSGVRRSGSSRSWKEPLEVGQPDLDERAHLVLEPLLAGQLERLLVARAGLLAARRPASAGCRR